MRTQNATLRVAKFGLKINSRKATVIRNLVVLAIIFGCPHFITL